MRARILDRYVFRTFFTSYLPLLLTFLLVFVIADAFPRAHSFLKSGEPFLTVFVRYYAVTLPVVFIRFGPFLTLAGAMFALARLERNNEVMPIKAGGVSVPRMLVPVFFCAAGLATLTVLDSELLIPRIAPRIRSAAQFERHKEVVPGILRDSDGNTLFAARYRPWNGTLRWVTFRMRAASGREQRVYYADRARWVEGPSGGRWVLEDGWIRDLLEEPAPGASGAAQPRYPQVRFGSGEGGVAIETSIIPIDVESLWEKGRSLLSFGDLRDQYRRQRYLPRLRVQLHERVTEPLGHLLLLLLGIPFVLRPQGGRSSVFVGALALVVVSTAYFVLSFISGELGAQGALPPLVAAWTPVVLFGGFGIWMFGRVPT